MAHSSLVPFGVFNGCQAFFLYINIFIHYIYIFFPFSAAFDVIPVIFYLEYCQTFLILLASLHPYKTICTAQLLNLSTTSLQFCSGPNQIVFINKAQICQSAIRYGSKMWFPKLVSSRPPAGANCHIVLMGAICKCNFITAGKEKFSPLSDGGKQELRNLISL